MKIHCFTVSSVYIKENKVPAIRLSGKWLTGLGFKIGRKFNVYEQSDGLLLTFVLPEDEEVQL
jgi:hypothetical protein